MNGNRIRKIIHMDLDAFFCAVEELRNPALKDKAFAVGGSPETRGVVASCSYAARRLGIHSAMPMARAVRICPNLIIISGSHRDYRYYSKQVMSILGNYTGLMEQISIDEAFLDVTDIQKEAGLIAKEIQLEIKRNLHLPSSYGVANSKLLAKIANDFGKKQHKGVSYPERITIIPPGEEKKFLAPLNVSSLWGVGKKTQESLEKIGVHTIGQLAGYDAFSLEKRFGKYAHGLIRQANGIDEREVQSGHGERKSISQERTYAKDIVSKDKLRKSLIRLSENIAFQLRREGIAGHTIKIKFRYADFSTFTRQITCDEPINTETKILDAAWSLLLTHWDQGKAIRLIGIGVSNFSANNYQLSFFDKHKEKENGLYSAIDSLKNKYGKEIIQRATNLEEKTYADDEEAF